MRLGYTELLDDRTMRLTAKGRKLATTVVRRHRLAERLLIDVIGLEWEKVHREADRWEHAISADVEEKLVELLGDPMTCPHGNPIPGTKRKACPRSVVSLREGRARSGHRRPHQREARAQRRGLQLVARARLIPGVDRHGREQRPRRRRRRRRPPVSTPSRSIVAEQMFVTA